MKKLLTFASVIALAVAFGLAGAASAKRPEGAGGGPPGGGSTSTVSQFSSRLVDVSCAVTDNLVINKMNCEKGTGEINGQGTWQVITSDLTPGGTYAICLVAVSAPVATPYFLAPLPADFEDSGTIVANNGDWVGLSFQIIEGSDCMGVVLQESGVSLLSELGDEEASTFTSPFVDVECVDMSLGDCEVTDSYVLINNTGDWLVLAYDLVRGSEYDICVDAVIAPEGLDPDTGGPLELPFRLATRSAQRRGTFLASGNMVDRYVFDGHWVGLSFQIYGHLLTAPCAGKFVQEIGINIVVSPP